MSSDDGENEIYRIKCSVDTDNNEEAERERDREKCST